MADREARIVVLVDRELARRGEAIAARRAVGGQGSPRHVGRVVLLALLLLFLRQRRVVRRAVRATMPVAAHRADARPHYRHHEKRAPIHSDLRTRRESYALADACGVTSSETGRQNVMPS